jgi:hypothetical protein
VPPRLVLRDRGGRGPRPRHDYRRVPTLGIDRTARLGSSGDFAIPSFLVQFGTARADPGC